MKNEQKQLVIHRLMILLLWVMDASQAFTVPTTTLPHATAAVTIAAKLPQQQPAPFHPPTTELIAAETIDPTAVITDALGGVVGSPLILAVPIVAALAVAGLVVFFIFSYASPAEQDDTDE